MSIQIEQFVKAVKSVSMGTFKPYAVTQCIYITERIVFSPVNDGCQIIEGIEYDGVFGHFIVNAKDLIARLKIVPKGSTITIRNLDGVITIAWGSGNFSINVENIDSFPGTFHEIEPTAKQEKLTTCLEFDITEFNRAITQTKSAMAYKDIRYYLNGLCLSLSITGHRVIATDGHRLHITPINQLNSYCGPHADLEVIIQDQGIEWITKTLPKVGTVSMQVDYRSNMFDKSIERSKYLVIKYGTTTIRLNSIDGRFPQWQRVLPSFNDRPLRIGVSPKQVIKTLKNCSSFSDAKFKKVKLSVAHRPGNDVLTIAAVSGDQVTYSEQIDVVADKANFSPDFYIGFSLDYLIDALSACTSDNDVMMCFSDNTNSLLIVDGEFQAVVMPMRL